MRPLHGMQPVFQTYISRCPFHLSRHFGQQGGRCCQGPDLRAFHPLLEGTGAGKPILPGKRILRRNGIRKEVRTDSRGRRTGHTPEAVIILGDRWLQGNSHIPSREDERPDGQHAAQGHRGALPDDHIHSDYPCSPERSAHHFVPLPGSEDTSPFQGGSRPGPGGTHGQKRGG